ncbi:MAG TPA: RNA polymerase sigma factor [Candidatus Nanoarchaeia archaeon]|nr:RNA polymerase sigma factor [Candidatus Nanoarchaeia archaeon]
MDARELFIDAVSGHQDLFHKIAYHILGDYRDAEDAVQTAYANTYSRLEQFRGKHDEHSMRAWIAMSVRNTARSDFGRRALRAHSSIGEDFPDSREQPYEELCLAELEKGVEYAIEQLSPRFRNVVAKVYEGYSTEEIARSTGRREVTVRVDLHRARVRLMERLHKYVSGDRHHHPETQSIK